jgi:hypothetical protein
MAITFRGQITATFSDGTTMPVEYIECDCQPTIIEKIVSEVNDYIKQTYNNRVIPTAKLAIPTSGPYSADPIYALKVDIGDEIDTRTLTVCAIAYHEDHIRVAPTVDLLHPRFLPRHAEKNYTNIPYSAPDMLEQLISLITRALSFHGTGPAPGVLVYE